MSITIIFLLILSIYLYTRYIFEKNQREQVVSSEEIDESQLRLDELEVEMMRVEEENLKMKEKIKKRNLKIGILLGFTLFLLFLYFKKRKRIEEDKKKFRELSDKLKYFVGNLFRTKPQATKDVAPLVRQKQTQGKTQGKQTHNIEIIDSKPSSSTSENDLSDVQEKIIGTEANISVTSDISKKQTEKGTSNKIIKLGPGDETQQDWSWNLTPNSNTMNETPNSNTMNETQNSNTSKTVDNLYTSIQSSTSSNSNPPSNSSSIQTYGIKNRSKKRTSPPYNSSSIQTDKKRTSSSSKRSNTQSTFNQEKYISPFARV